MLVMQLVVAALSAAFHWKARVAVLEAFRAYDTPLPPLTSVALAPWLLPGAVGLGFVLTAGAMVAPLRRSQRNAIVGAALVISSTALVFAVLAAFAPIFRPT